MNAAFYGGALQRPATAPLAPRAYAGQMCGVHVPSLPPVAGGGADDSLVLSWFYPRYENPTDRARIREAWGTKYPDALMSWQDDAAASFSYEQIVESRQELCAAGFRPCEMLASKYYSPAKDGPGTWALIQPMLERFIAADCISRYCVGWELDLFNDYTSLQYLIDKIAPLVAPRPLYVHFSPGYADWRPDHPGSTFAEFWNAQVGKLTGLLHQAVTTWSEDEYRGRLTDILERFAGGFGVVPDSGFGHPFDLVELEITAIDQFNGHCTEEQGDARARFALGTPAVKGVSVMGSGNGF